MEPVRPPVRLAAKALPRVQATTVLALKQMSSTDDATLMMKVAELAQWGAPPRLITELIGVPNGDALRRLCEKQQGRIQGGRPAESVGALLDSPLMHLQSSIFLREFVVQHTLDGRGVMADQSRQ